MMIRRVLLVCAVAVLAAEPASASTKLVMKGTGTTIVEIDTLDQGDGSKSQSYRSHLIQTIVGGDHAGETIGGECIGYGNISGSGTYAGTLRCTYRLNEKDSYTVDLNDTETGGTMTVLGGSGAFAGAGGGGTYTYTWGDTLFGDKLTWTAETTIELP